VTGTAAGGRGSEFRPELEGLRAVAVGLVVLYHGGISALAGGFVGVDVFFVLSGFLITGLIVRELRETGTLSLPAFYARRARRLLPAAAVVLVATVVASAVVMPPLRVPDVAGDAAAAAVYASNLRFALQATDYLAAELAPSPLLHFWSLGVEEQFYLFWPALLALVAVGLGRRRAASGSGLDGAAERRPDGSAERRLILVVAGVAVASFALGVVLTDVAEPWAFFSLPARAWELALGALIALGVARLSRLPRAIGGPTVAAGLAMVVVAGLALNETIPFPGLAALLPTGGAALVIAGSVVDRGSLPARLLAVPPMRFLGRISYSLYLWHWPLFVLPAVALDRELPVLARLGLAGIAVLLAAATQRWVEDPLRHGRWVGTVPRRNLALAGLVSVLVAGVSLGAGRMAILGLPSGSAAAEALGNPAVLPPDPLAGVLDPDAAPSAGAGSGPVSPEPGKPSESSAPSESIEPSEPSKPYEPSKPNEPGTGAPSLAPDPTAPPATQPGPVPTDLLPPLAAARDSLPAIYRDGCHLDQPSTVSGECVYGDAASDTTVVLFGDSHAASWFPTLERLATANRWRLVSLTKSACAVVDATVYNGSLGRAYTECDRWRVNALERIESERPDLVVVTNARTHVLALPEGRTPALARPDVWDAALERTLRRLKAIAGDVALVADIPRADVDPPVCLSSSPDDRLACATPAAVALEPSRTAADAAIADRLGLAFVDPTSWICPSDPCPVVIGRFLVYRDEQHLATPFATALARRMLDALSSQVALGPAPRPGTG